MIDIVRELASFGVRVSIHDPIADPPACEHEYGGALTAWDDLPTASALVAAVPHREYAEMGFATLATRLVPGGLFADVKCAHDPQAVLAAGLRLWRL